MVITLRPHASDLREASTQVIDSLDDFCDFFEGDAPGGFAMTHWAGQDPQVDEVLQPLKVTPRCIPQTDNPEPGTCPFTGRESRQRIVFSKSY